MSVPLNPTNLTAQQKAEEAIREVLYTQHRRDLFVLVQSPPGAGKTALIERLAIQNCDLFHERVMVVTFTNEQTCALAYRLAVHYHPHRVYLLLRKDLTPHFSAGVPGNLTVAHNASGLPSDGPCIVVANACLWFYQPAGALLFSCMLIDEAYQIPFYSYERIADLARRFVLVGDPGQIAPIIPCLVDRWQHDLAGPQVPTPQGCQNTVFASTTIGLPVTRRLPADTVQIIQPIWYPTLPFIALSPPGQRSLLPRRPSSPPSSALHQAIDLAASGCSLVRIELPAAITGEYDHALIDAMLMFIEALFEREVYVCDDDGVACALTPSMLGIVCPYISQVSSLTRRLPSHAGVLVETADRFQGLERPIMCVYHPLSGFVQFSSFHLDRGRFSVMLSRHRIACFVFARSGIESRLLHEIPESERILGVTDDPLYGSWKAHLAFLQATRHLVLRM